MPYSWRVPALGLRLCVRPCRMEGSVSTSLCDVMVSYILVLPSGLLSTEAAEKVDFLLPWTSTDGDVVQPDRDMPDWAVTLRLHKLLRKIGVEEPGAYSKHSAKTLHQRRCSTEDGPPPTEVDFGQGLGMPSTPTVP